MTWHVHSNLLNTSWRQNCRSTICRLFTRGLIGLRYLIEPTLLLSTVRSYTSKRPCRSSMRLVAGLPPRRPVFASGQHVGVCCGQSGTGAGFPRILRFPLPVIPHKFSIIIITRGWHNRPISGRSAEWTQLGSIPPLYQFKFYTSKWIRIHFRTWYASLAMNWSYVRGKHGK
jgi:hypothetical protein